MGQFSLLQSFVLMVSVLSELPSGPFSFVASIFFASSFLRILFASKIMDVLNKGLTLTWDNDGRQHERFMDWKLSGLHETHASIHSQGLSSNRFGLNMKIGDRRSHFIRAR